MNTKRERSKSRTASLAMMLVLLFSAILVIPFITPITMASGNVYNFVGIDTSSTTHLAYSISRGDLCYSQPPASLDMGTFFSYDGWYEEISINDGNVASFAVTDGYYYMRFRFKIDEDINTIDKFDILWDGVGIAPSANGYTLYIWNSTSWEELNSTLDGGETTLTGEVTSDISNYIDEYLYILTETNGQGEGFGKLAHMQCDYVELVLEFEEAEILATTDIDPDTLNLKSKGKWVTAYIELPDGYDVTDIYVSTVKISDINGNSMSILAENQPIKIGDYDSDDVIDLMVKFDRSEVGDNVSPSDATITVTGELTDGTSFEGSDTIRVIDKGKGK